MLSEETIRQNLIRLRKEHDMTQKKVAELLCKSRGAYTAYEHGYAVPSYMTLERLSEIYGVSIEIWGKEESFAVS